MSILTTDVKIILDNSKFKKGLDEAKAAGEKFGSAIKSTAKVATAAMAAVSGAVVGVTKSLADGIKETAAYGDEIDKNSQKVGMSAEAYQQWDYVMNLAGTSMSNCTMGMKTMTNQIGQAQKGSEEAAENFKKLGISTKDLDKMSREEVFAKVIEGFQGMEDSTERAALANKMFGKSGQEMTPLFNMSKEELAEATKNFKDYNMALSDDGVKASAAFQDSMTTMQNAFGGLKRNLLAEFLPSVTTVMDGLTEIFAGDTESGIAKIEEGINGFSEQLNTMLPKFIEIGGNIATALVTAIIDTLPTLLTSLINATTTLLNGIIEHLPQIINAVLQVAPQLFEAALLLMTALAQGISENLPELIPSIIEIILEMTRILYENIPMLIEAAKELIFGLIYGLWEAKDDLLLAVGGLFMSFLRSIWSLFGIDEGGQNEFAEIGLQLIEGLWQGIADAYVWLIDKISGFVDGVTSKIKDFFGIASPSKLFEDQVGKNLALGIGVGFTTNMDDVEQQMQEALPTSLDVAAGFTTQAKISSPVENSRDELVEMFKYGTAKTSVENTRDLRRAVNA